MQSIEKQKRRRVNEWMCLCYDDIIRRPSRRSWRNGTKNKLWNRWPHTWPHVRLSNTNMNYFPIAVLPCALCMFKICFSLSIFFRARTRNGNRAIYSQFIVKVWGGEQQADYINIKLGQRQYNDCKYYMFVCRYNLSKIKNTKQFSCWMVWLGTQSPNGMFVALRYSVFSTLSSHCVAHKTQKQNDMNYLTTCAHIHTHSVSSTMSDTFCIVQMKHLKFDKWQNAKRHTITENLSLLSVRSKNDDGWEKERKMQILLLLMRIHVHNKFPGKHTAETETLADNEMALKIVHGEPPIRWTQRGETSSSHSRKMLQQSKVVNGARIANRRKMWNYYMISRRIVERKVNKPLPWCSLAT